MSVPPEVTCEGDPKEVDGVYLLDWLIVNRHIQLRDGTFPGEYHDFGLGRIKDKPSRCNPGGNRVSVKLKAVNVML